MLFVFLMLSLLIWICIIFYQINLRSFTIFLVWLLIAPVASNLINKPTSNPFFSIRSTDRYNAGQPTEIDNYVNQETNISLQDLIEPTRTLFTIFIAIYLSNIVLKRKFVVLLDKPETWMFVFSLILLVNVVLLSMRVAKSLRVGTDAFIVPFLGYFIMRRLVTGEHRFQQLVRVLAYLAAYLIVIACLEQLMGGLGIRRISGPFRFRDLLYIVMITAFFMVLPDQFRSAVEKRTTSSGIRWFVLSLSPIIILMTWTRGNWLGFLSGFWLFLFLARRLIGFSQKVLAIGLGLLLAAILLTAVPALMPDELIEDRITRTTTVYSRLATWSVLIQEGLKSPLSGIGFNNLRALLPSIITVYEGRRSQSHAHNSYLALFAELGAVGLVAYLGMAFSILRMGLSLYYNDLGPQAKWYGISVISILVGYLIPPLTSTVLYVHDVSHVYVFTSIGAVAGLYSSKPRTL